MVKSEAEVLMVEREVFPATSCVILNLLDLKLNSGLVGSKCHIEDLSFKVGKTQVVLIGWLIGALKDSFSQVIHRFSEHFLSRLIAVALSISNSTLSYA